MNAPEDPSAAEFAEFAEFAATIRAGDHPRTLDLARGLLQRLTAATADQVDVERQVHTRARRH